MQASPIIQAADMRAMNFALNGGSPSASDNSPALQALVDRVCNNNLATGRSIYIPAGTWNFASTIKIQAAGLKFIGAGNDFWDVQNGTILQYNGTAARSLTDVVTTNGNPTISSASAPFIAAHAGATILLTGANVGGTGVNTLSVGIQSVVDSQHVILKTSPQATLTGVVAQVQDDFFRIGSDDGHAWDAAEYNGFSNTEFHHLAITGVGNTTGANTLANLYAYGTYGIRDWRGGSVIINRCWISHFEVGFFGVNSDFNQFSWVQFNYNHIGNYFGPRSDQSTHDNVQYADCDTGLMIRGASRFTDVGGTYVNCGSATTYGIDIGNEAQFTGVNAWAIHFLNPWFEINTNPASFPAFVKIHADTNNQVLNVVIDNAFCTGPTYPATPSCQYFAEIGNASKVSIRDAQLQPQFQHLLHFTAVQANRPQVVTLTGGRYSPQFFSIPQIDSIADANTNPVFAPGVTDGSGTYGQTVFDVRSYGALTTNADNASNINAAVTAASAAGGGVVYIPPGTWLSGAITLASNVHLRGAGRGATILQLKNGANVDLLSANVSSINMSASFGTGSAGGINSFQISDITLDGNKSNNTSGYPLQFYGFNHRLHGLIVRNGASGGIRCDWNGGAVVGPDMMESFWSDIKIHGNAGIGLEMGGPHDSHFRDVLIYSNDGHNLVLWGNAAGNSWVNSHVYSSTHGLGAYGIICIGGTNRFTNCRSEDSDQAQVLVLGDGFQWTSGSAIGDDLANSITLQFGQTATTVYGRSTIAGTVAGTFQDGETITQATSGATAQIVFNGGNQTTSPIKVCNLVGAPDATHTWTGGTSGATITSPSLPVSGSGTIKPTGNFSPAKVKVDSTLDGGAINNVTGPSGEIKANSSRTTGSIITGSFSSTAEIQLTPPKGLTPDGTTGKGGQYNFPVKSSTGFTITDTTQFITNVNTSSKIFELVNNTHMDVYSDNYSTKVLTLNADGNGQVGCRSVVVNTATADQNSNSITFNTQGQAGNATGAVLSGKNLSVVQADGYDGSAFSVGGTASFSAKENWSSGHHGTSYTISCVLSAQTSLTSLAIFNYDGNGSIQFPLGNQLLYNSGGIEAKGFLNVTGNTTTLTNPYAQISDGNGTALVQLITNSGGYFYGSGLAIRTTTNDDLWFATNGTKRLYLHRSGEVIWQQDTSATAILDNATINTQSVPRIRRFAPIANRTGIIMQPGFATGDSNATQEIIIRNESAFTMTFAVTATSNVIGGTSKVIPAYSSVLMTFDGTNWN